MTTTEAPLGDLLDMAKALGLAGSDGSIDGDWLTRPGDFLGSMLSDDGQRAALLAFVTHVLDSGPLVKDGLGRTFAPVAEITGGGRPKITVGVVLDERASGFVGLGLGLQLEVADPHLTVDASIPLFRSGRGDSKVPDNLFIGQPGADITLRAELQLAGGPPAPGEAHVGGVSVAATIPTDLSTPTLSLSLHDLQLPGGAAPRDVTVDPADPGALGAALRDLVFALAQTGADTLAGAAGALAGLLGLRSTDPLPGLPLDRLATDGPRALAGWLDAVLADAGSAGTWLGYLADALGGTRAGDTVSVDLGDVNAFVKVSRQPSPTGLGRITVAAGATLQAGPGGDPDQVVVQASADLCTVDLQAPSVTLLPQAAVFARIGPAVGPAALVGPVGSPAVTVGALRVGLGIGADHLPVFVLAADRVQVGSDTYASVDLTNPGAIAQVAANAGAALLDDLLAALGPLGAVLHDLLGVGAAVAPLDVVAFVADPLHALAARWKALLADGASVAAALTLLRDLVADAVGAAVPVVGDGSPPDTGAGPWRIALVGTVELQAWRSGPDRLMVALAARARMDTLGQRCTLVKTTVVVELVELDLAKPSAAFLPGVSATLALSARGADEAVVPLGPFTIMSKPIGVTLGWRPGAGLAAGLDLREVMLAWDGHGLFDVPIPTIAADGTVTLDADGWAAVETVIGIVAGLSPDPWLAHATQLFGWDPSIPTATVRLALADLVADPVAAVEGFLVRLALDDLGLLAGALEVVARLFTGVAGLGGGILSGRGTAPDPLLVPIGHHPRAPALSLFVDAEPAATAAVNVGPDVQIWRPGGSGLTPGALADAIAAEAIVDPTVADLLRGRPDVAGGLDALLARWTGSDGVVVAPTEDPAGETVHRLDDVDHRSLADAALGLLGAITGLDDPPPVLVCVADGTPAESPFTAAAGDVVVDLSTAELAPKAFVLPAAAAGRYVVALGSRAGAKVTGDALSADPALRQAERLGRLLDALLALGQPTAVIAHGGSGHAARLAAGTRVGIGWLLLAGTPTDDVALLALDAQPGADALRLLDALLHSTLAPVGPGDPADTDLALGRALVDGFMALTRLDDPGADLRPPPTPAATPAGEVHRVLGELTEERVTAGMTAVVLAGLSARARRRAQPLDPDAGAQPPSAAWVGLRLPLPDIGGPSATSDLSGWAELLLYRAGRTAQGAEVATRPHLRLHVEVGGAGGGWLAGGPDPSRGTAPRPPVELRRLHVDLTVPLPGAGAEPVVKAELVLHDAYVFGVRRERWVVRPLDAGDGATPVLPEVRALLSAAAGRWRTAADPTTVLLRTALTGLGLLQADGTMADAVEQLVTDPDAFLSSVVSAGRRDVVAGGLAALLGGGATATGATLTWTADTATITADLAAGTVDVVTAVALGGDPAPAVAWHGTFHYGPTAQVDLSMGFGASAGAAPIRVTTGPFKVVVDAPNLGLPAVTLWPIDPGGAWAKQLALAAARYVPAEIGRLALDRLRTLDVDAQPVVDALLDALGLLTPAGPSGRRLRSVYGLLTDPAAWFTELLHQAGHVDAGRLAGLLDGVGPVLGLGGGPGRWDLAPGVALRAITNGSGHAALALSLDTTGMAPPPGATARLWAKVDAGVAFGDGPAAATLALEVGSGTSGSVHVDVAPAVTVELRPGGANPLRLYPDPAGLGQLAAAALAAGAPAALAEVLDAVAGRAGQAGLEGDAGDLVVALGDALDLRTAAKFDADRLHALADAPGPYLTARAAAVATALAARLEPLFSIPASRLAVTAPGGVLTITAGMFTATVTPAPFRVGLAGRVTGIAGIEELDLAVAVGAAGLEGFALQIGPAPLPVGGASLRPYARFVPAAGNPATEARRVELGLGLSDDGTKLLGFQWLLDTGAAQLVRVDGGVPSTAPAELAAAVVEVLADAVAAVVLAVDEVDQALDNRHVGAKTIRQILSGVVLTDDGTAVSPGISDPDRLLGRAGRLAKNLAGAAPPVTIDGTLTVAPAVNGDQVGLTVGLTDGQRHELVSDPITISLETDASWINRPGGAPVPPGIQIFAASITDVGAVTFTPGVSINGIGLRFAKSGGPLLDAGLRLDSLAVHGYCEIDEATRAGGGQVELAGLGVALGGASGGDNAIASGIMGDAKGDSSSPPPKFSPALSVQKHGGDGMKVGLRAGPGDGPWWVAVQRGLGPVYIEQLGFGVTLDHDDLKSLSLLIDGKVSLFGLTAEVDDLRITYFVVPGASLFEARSWGADLGGLAISGDLSGLAISGGLLKLGAGDDLQYLGSLAVKFGPYGLSVFGGYAKQHDVVSFFAFGALNAPIGGPPAFFVTGIGGGIGINRGIVFPTDLTHFNEFPFIRALDPAASPPADPMAALKAMVDIFPIKPGNFWFAAGLSFTSFALIDGVVVISVQIGDGLELALLGLARVALPRPQFALVSIELGLLARFSTSEGCFIIQAALTDNSWVLVKQLRLTGGFAFGTWWKGPNKGHAVMTIGGYHPQFHRDGYPEVPRIGASVDIGIAAVKVGFYFALTSEAIMAGGRFEASVDLGFAGASLEFEANGIIYFDPFQYEVDAHARVSAWADLWLFTIHVSISASIEVKGPDFHGKASLDLGPTSIDVEFGSDTPKIVDPIAWEAFVAKYLEEATPGVPRALSAVTGKGSLPAQAGEGADRHTPDGATIPYRVYAEFEALLTTSIPAKRVEGGGAAVAQSPTGAALGLAPHGKANVDSTVRLSLLGEGNVDHLGALRWVTVFGGGFPVAVWGPPPKAEPKPIPKGVVIEAITGVALAAVADIPVGTKPIPYHQVETGPRQPNPLAAEARARAAYLVTSSAVAGLVASQADPFGTAREWLADAGASRLERLTLAGQRAAPPILGTLGDGLTADAAAVIPTVAAPVAVTPFDRSVHAPRLRAVLSPAVQAAESARLRTSVADPGDAVEVVPRGLAEVAAAMGPGLAARLNVVPAAGASDGRTVLAAGAAPLSRSWRTGAAAVAAAGEGPDGKARLRSLEAAMTGRDPEPATAADLAAGEVAVLELPNARADTEEADRPSLVVTGPARVVMLGADAEVLAERESVDKAEISVPVGTDTIAVAAGPVVEASRPMRGWHAGLAVPYVGWGTAVLPGATARFQGARVGRGRERLASGWVTAGELATDVTVVTTRFAAPATTVAVLVEGTAVDPALLGIALVGGTFGGGDQPDAPVAVVAGLRTALLYRVGVDGAFGVTVTVPAGARLAAVLAGADPLETVAATLVEVGVEALVPAAATSGPERVQVSWVPGNAGQPG